MISWVENYENEFSFAQDVVLACRVLWLNNTVNGFKGINMII